MKNALWYFVTSFLIIYDKLFPNDAKKGKDGKVKRKGMIRLLLAYVAVVYLTRYIFHPLYDTVMTLSSWFIIILMVMSFVRYCNDTPVRNYGGGYIPTAQSKKAKRKTKAQNPSYDTNQTTYYVDDEEAEEMEKSYMPVDSTKKSTAPKTPQKKYSSPLEEQVISEVLYGLPFDPTIRRK